MNYSAFNSLQKVIFVCVCGGGGGEGPGGDEAGASVVLYSEEVNQHIFVMIQCKISCHNYLCSNVLFLFSGFKTIRRIHFSCFQNS